MRGCNNKAMRRGSHAQILVFQSSRSGGNFSSVTSTGLLRGGLWGGTEETVITSNEIVGGGSTGGPGKHRGGGRPFLRGKEGKKNCSWRARGAPENYQTNNPNNLAHQRSVWGVKTMKKKMGKTSVFKGRKGERVEKVGQVLATGG